MRAGVQLVSGSRASINYYVQTWTQLWYVILFPVRCLIYLFLILFDEFVFDMNSAEIIAAVRWLAYFKL